MPRCLSFSFASALLGEELFENFLRKVGVGEDLGYVVEFFEFVKEAKSLERLRFFERYGVVGYHRQLGIFNPDLAERFEFGFRSCEFVEGEGDAHRGLPRCQHLQRRCP